MHPRDVERLTVAEFDLFVEQLDKWIRQSSKDIDFDDD